MNKNQRGSAFVDMLIVLAILGVIASIVYTLIINVFPESKYSPDWPMSQTGFVEGYEDASTEFSKTMVVTDFGTFKVRGSVSGLYGEEVGLQGDKVCFPKRGVCYKII